MRQYLSCVEAVGCMVLGGRGAAGSGEGALQGRRSRGLFSLLLGAVAALLSACGEQYPTYRYRLTVEVVTPEGLRTGSSVIEVRTHEGPAFPGPEAATIQSRVRGEAVAVGLGPRGTLFALLSSPDRQTGASGYAWALLPNPPARGGDVEARRENYRALQSVRGQAELAPNLYPMMVRFRDISNPITVERVDPSNLAEEFGVGVQLRRISVEMTEDSVSTGIERRLNWLPRLQGGYLHGRLTGRGAPFGLHGGDFSSETFK